ncbi:hypothetical protein ACTXG6_36945 [Pseudonocardia sp. Cha107L01]|uniref:hypothetical protein n=1 Tax=Pseudonocardia sp. Cha107L01 TaxID=3457576 RepID=UPI00403E7C56
MLDIEIAVPEGTANFDAVVGLGRVRAPPVAAEMDDALPGTADRLPTTMTSPEL